MNKPLPALLALCCVATFPQCGQSATRPTVADFVTVFNAGGADAISTFYRAHVQAPPGAPGARDDEIGDLRALRAAIGPIKLKSVRDSPRAVVATVKAEHGWYRFSFMTLPRGGAKPFGAVLGDLALPPLAPNQNIQQYLRSIAAARYFSGSVLIAKPRSAPFCTAYGTANRQTGTPNTIDTLFNIGSVGKLFTTVAIYQLLERGTVHLNDTIAHWLPDYPNGEASGATVDQLLQMRSGIGDFFSVKFHNAPHAEIRALADYLPFFASDPLAFKPGAGERYSNGGYLVLGLIVEKASGEDFYSYAKEHIFDPAGMMHTAYLTVTGSPAKRAVGYTRRWSGPSTWSTPVQSSQRDEPGRGSSAGGTYSTVGDLLKFSEALRDGTLVKGRYPWNRPGHLVLGGAPGWNAAFLREDGFTVIVLANQDPPAAQNLVEEVAPLLRTPKRS